jgi:hypothetical protein
MYQQCFLNIWNSLLPVAKTLQWTQNEKKKSGSIFKNRLKNPGVVAHACDTSYSGGKSGGSQFDANLGEMFMRSHLNQWLGIVVHACHPSYRGSTNRRITAQSGTLSKDNQKA